MYCAKHVLILPHLSFTPSHYKYYYSPHFVDEETDAKRGQVSRGWLYSQ